MISLRKWTLNLMPNKKNNRLTLTELANLCGASLIGDASHVVCGVNSLDQASSDELSFYQDQRYENDFLSSNAGVICISPKTTQQPGKNYLVCEHPSVVFQKLLSHFIEPVQSFFKGVDPSAKLAPDVILGENVTVGPYCVIDASVVIGNDCKIGPFTYIGPNVSIGDHVTIDPRVTIYQNTQIDHHVTVQSGAVLGSAGFGYHTNDQGVHERIEHHGDLHIEQYTDIGANTTVDRGRFSATKIGKGSKIDNLVHIAHNVQLGTGNLLAAQTGIAGSSTTGKYVFFGGQSGVLGHVHLNDEVKIGAQSGVSKSLSKGIYTGTPAAPLLEKRKQEVFIRKWEEVKNKLKMIENLLKIKKTMTNNP